MINKQFVLNLCKHFGDTSASWRLAALRQEPLVWDSLISTPLGELALTQSLATLSEQAKQVNILEGWSPAAMGLLSLDFPVSLSNVKDPDWVALEPEPRLLADQAYEAWITGIEHRAQESLPEASRIALAMRERYVFHGGWQFLNDIFGNTDKSRRAIKPVTACLVGMVPDPNELLLALLTIDTDLGTHTFLCHPAPAEEQAAAFSELISMLPEAQRVKAMLALSRHRADLAARLTNQVFDALSDLSVDRVRFLDGVTQPEAVQQVFDAIEINFISTYSNTINHLMQRASALIAGQRPEQAIQLHHQAQQVCRCLQGYLTSQTALAYRSLPGEEGSAASLQAWEQAIQLDPANVDYTATYSLALLNENRYEDAQRALDTIDPQVEEAADGSFLYWSAAARLAAIERKPERATASLLRATESTQASQQEIPNLLTMAELALELDDLEAADRLVDFALEIDPTGPTTLALKCQAQLAKSQLEQALVYANLAFIFRPDAGMQHLVIHTLEANHEWTAALEEHRRLICRLNPPTPADWREMAACALQAGQPEAAIEYTQEALKMDPKDGLAVELLGEIALSESNPGLALEYFLQAVEFSPGQVSPWLSLARLYQGTGQTTRSLETLRQASQAVPDSAEIHLALGQTLLYENSPTLALIPLRQADGIISNDQFLKTHPNGWNSIGYKNSTKATRRAIALSLGKTLRQLGFLEESKRVFEQVCSGNVHNPAIPELLFTDRELSYSYAQTLMALGENVKALPWLEFVVSCSDDPPADLDYARALLSSSPTLPQIQRAIDLLEKVLEIDDVNSLDSSIGKNLLLGQADYAEASALLAESLQITGDLPRALQAYRQALDSNLVQQPTWRYRLSFGLGQAAKALGFHETAIASFLEACQVDPSCPFLFRNLAEAYAAVDLPADAYKAACEAVRLDNANPEMLDWFAALCLSLYNRPSGKGLPLQLAALNALQDANSLAPERADLLVRLASTQLRADDRISVLATLNQLSDQTAGEMILTITDLQQAAELLCKIGEASQAAELLVRAIQLSKIEQPDEHPQTISLQAGLFNSLARTYQMAGNLPGGLAAVDQALILDPGSQTFHLQKSTLLLEIGDLVGAVANLEHLLTLLPDSWEAHMQLALIQHARGDLMAAMAQTETALGCLKSNEEGTRSDTTDPSNTTEQLSSIELAFTSWQAAELAQSLLMGQRAQATLTCNSLTDSFYANACLQAELALNQSDLESTAVAIASIVETEPHHPRLLALQSRLVARQEGVSETGLQLLRSAIEYASNRNNQEILKLFAAMEHHRNLHALLEPFYVQQVQNLQRAAILQGLAEAALELKQWQDAKVLCEELSSLEPESPSAYLLHVRTLVLQAEMQRLCQALRILKHTPGQEALSEVAHQAFDYALLNAADRIELNAGAAVQQVTRWRVRGKAVFTPDQESGATLLSYCESAVSKEALSVDDLAALIWSLGESKQLETAQQWSQRMPNDPLVNIVFALAISEAEPDRAIYLAQKSLERLAYPDLNLPDARPMLDALIAVVSSRLDARPVEQQLALDSIQAALKIWPDEARWHALAADILLSLPMQESQENPIQPEDENAAKIHLESAARLEPNLAEHHLKLGRWYAIHGDIDLAIAETEKATFVEPDLIEPWLELAGLQKEAGDLEKAVHNAERVLGFTNQPAGSMLDALLLRCELAYLTNNPRGTLSRAQAILNLNPNQPKAWFLLAKAHEALEQPVEALAAIERAISFTDEPLELQQMRVRLLHALYGPQTAIQAIQSLLEVYPGEPVLNTLLADYWFEINDPANAIQAARLALQTGQVKLSHQTQSHLHLVIGAQSRLAGQLDQSVYHLNEAIRKDPENVEAYLELGRTHQDRRQNNQALEIYQLAAKIAPHDYRSYYQAGLALKDIKDYLEAETMFRRAARLAPNEVSIHRQLAAVVALNLVHNRRAVSPAVSDRIE